jgi:hypothetical protein
LLLFFRQDPFSAVLEQNPSEHDYG